MPRKPQKKPKSSSVCEAVSFIGRIIADTTVPHHAAPLAAGILVAEEVHGESRQRAVLGATQASEPAQLRAGSLREAAQFTKRTVKLCDSVPSFLMLDYSAMFTSWVVVDSKTAKV